MVITPAVVVKVTDSGGNPVSGVTIALTAQGGPGVLSGAAPVATDASGLATFPTLSINKAGTYALLATDGTHVTTSASFVISAGAASSITVSGGSPQSTTVLAPFAVPLQVLVRDAAGNPRSGSRSPSPRRPREPRRGSRRRPPPPMPAGMPA